MSKFFTCLSLSVIAAGLVMSASPVRVVPKDDSTGKLHRVVKGTKLGAQVTDVAASEDSKPSRVKLDASVNSESEILFEDFNNVPDGAQQTIGTLGDRYIDCLATEDEDDAQARYIDSSYTPETGTWEGHEVYAGKGGTVVLQCYNPAGYPAALRTPLGDYSGDITVKVRCRFSTPFYGYNNDLGYSTSGGTQLSCRAGIGGYATNNDATTDIEGISLDSNIFYESEGWHEITFTFRNESANANGFIELRTLFALEIDWIKITDAGTFLAAPAVEDATDFTNDGFTINWDPVRHSYDYYIDLWKMQYTSEAAVYSIDFDGNAVPEDWTANDTEIANAVGSNGSNALRYNSNGISGSLQSPEFSEKIASASFSAMFEINDENALNGYGIYGMMYVDGLTDSGWEAIQDADIYCDGQLTESGVYYDVNLSGESFSNKYSAIRIYEYGVNSTNHLVIDDVNIQLQRPYKLERVIGDVNGAIRDTENDDANYNRYYFTGDPKAPCTYTFTGLEPESEYYYRVRSHNVSVFAGTEKHHAFGVANPKLLPATNITSDNYTANWEDVAKAQSYVVSNYKLDVLDEDVDDYCVFAETFAKCEGGKSFDTMTPMNNVESGNIDDYTDMPGWTGKNNYVGNGFIGGDWFTDTQLITPPLSIDPEKGTYTIYLEAYGYKGDALYIEFEKAGVYTTVSFTSGMLSGEFEVPAVSDGERLKFYSYNYYPYALNQLKVSQNKSKGDIVRTYSSEVVVPAGVGSAEFSKLQEDALYEYGVKARYDLESQTAYSLGNDVIRVDLANKTKLNAITANSSAYEVARYDVCGRAVSKDYKGFVIVKMSDGTSNKILVR